MYVITLHLHVHVPYMHLNVKHVYVNKCAACCMLIIALYELHVHKDATCALYCTTYMYEMNYDSSSLEFGEYAISCNTALFCTHIGCYFFSNTY